MIPMSETLKAAVKMPRHTPFARLTVRDQQFRWASIHGDGDESACQTALALSGSAWVRVRLGPGGSVQAQRITDPTDPDQWLAWETLRESGAVSDVAVSAEGNLARAFAIVSESGTWSVLAWTSSDGGATWGSPVTVVQSSDLVTSIASPKPDAVAWVACGILRLALWDGQAWGVAATWSAGQVTEDYGIAAAWRDGVYRFLAAGLLDDGAYLRAVTWDGAAWSEPGVLVPTGRPAETLVPRWPSLAWAGDRWLAAFLDTFDGSLTYQTPSIRWSWDFDHWSVPCALNLNSDGPTRANLLAEPGRVVAAMEVSALAAATGGALTEYAHVLRAERREEEGYGSLLLDLHDDGTLAGAPLLPYAEAVLRLGCHTEAGAEGVDTAPLYITSVHRVRGESRPGVETIVRATDGWGLLHAWQAVTTHTWTDVTLGWMLAELLMRAAGLRLQTDDSAAWDIPLSRFSVARGTHGDTAVRTLLRRAGARARWDADGAMYAFVAAGQPWSPDWTYDVEILRARCGVAAAGVTLARVAGLYPAVGQAQDVRAAQEQGRTLGTAVTDDYLTTSAQCADAAAALVGQGTARALRDRLTSAIVPGLQALDQVVVDDAALGMDGAERRVVSVRTVCDALRGTWEQTVELEGV